MRIHHPNGLPIDRSEVQQLHCPCSCDQIFRAKTSQKTICKAGDKKYRHTTSFQVKQNIEHYPFNQICNETLVGHKRELNYACNTFMKTWTSQHALIITNKIYSRLTTYWQRPHKLNLFCSNQLFRQHKPNAHKKSHYC